LIDAGDTIVVNDNNAVPVQKYGAIQCRFIVEAPRINLSL
jgi:hypothetical protein